MTPGQRRWIFLAAMAGLAAFYLWGLTELPGFGNYPGPYGDIINRVAVAQTNATGVVSAVNFEYRGFDTVGEEFILFVAATGMAVVLRHLRSERQQDDDDPTADWTIPPASMNSSPSQVSPLFSVQPDWTRTARATITGATTTIGVT